MVRTSLVVVVGGAVWVEAIVGVEAEAIFVHVARSPPPHLRRKILFLAALAA